MSGIRRPFRFAFAILAVALPVAGCLEAPGIEETWTRIDLETPGPLAVVTPGDSVSITVHGEVVYRSILTGGIIAEVRVSPTLAPGDVRLDPDAPRLEMMRDVDRILAASTSVGTALVPFTGWDHLIQDIDLTVPCQIPADPGAGGVFLLLYLADIEEVELPSGETTFDITPFEFETKEVLPTGVVLIPGGGP